MSLSPVRRDDILRMYSMHFFDAGAEPHQHALKELREPSLKRWATISKIVQDMEKLDTYRCTPTQAHVLDHADGIPRIPIPHADGVDITAYSRSCIDTIWHMDSRHDNHCTTAAWVASNVTECLAGADEPRHQQCMYQYQEPPHLHHEQKLSQEQQETQHSTYFDTARDQQGAPVNTGNRTQYSIPTNDKCRKRPSSAVSHTNSQAPYRSASIPAKNRPSYQPAVPSSQRPVAWPPQSISPAVASNKPDASPHAVVPQSARRTTSCTTSVAVYGPSRWQHPVDPTVMYEPRMRPPAPAVQHDTVTAELMDMPPRQLRDHTTKPMMPPRLYDNLPLPVDAAQERAVSPEFAWKTVRSASPFVHGASSHNISAASRWPNVPQSAHHGRTDATYFGSAPHCAEPMAVSLSATFQSSQETLPGLNSPGIPASKAIHARHDLSTFKNMQQLSPAPSIPQTPQHAVNSPHVAMHQNQELSVHPNAFKRVSTVASRSSPSQSTHLAPPAPSVCLHATPTCADFRKDENHACPTIYPSSEPRSPPVVQTTQPVHTQARSTENQCPQPTSLFSRSPTTRNPRTIHPDFDSPTYHSSQPLSPSCDALKPVSAYPYSPPRELSPPASPPSSLPAAQNLSTAHLYAGSVPYERTQVNFSLTCKARNPVLVDLDSAVHPNPLPESLGSREPNTAARDATNPVPAPSTYPEQQLPLSQSPARCVVELPSHRVDHFPAQHTALSHAPAHQALNSDPETVRPPTPPKRSMLQSFARGLPMHHASPPLTHRAEVDVESLPRAFVSPPTSVSTGSVHDTPKFGNDVVFFPENRAVQAVFLSTTDASTGACVRDPGNKNLENHGTVGGSCKRQPVTHEGVTGHDAVVRKDHWAHNASQPAPKQKHCDGSLPVPRTHCTERNSLDSHVKSAVRVADARQSAGWSNGPRNSAPALYRGMIDACADIEKNSTPHDAPLITSHRDTASPYAPHSLRKCSTVMSVTTAQYMDRSPRNATCISDATTFLHAEHSQRTDDAINFRTTTLKTVMPSPILSDAAPRDCDLRTPPTRVRAVYHHTEEKQTSQNTPFLSCVKPLSPRSGFPPVRKFSVHPTVVNKDDASVDSVVSDGPRYPNPNPNPNPDPDPDGPRRELYGPQSSSVTSCSVTSMPVEHPLSTPASSLFPSHANARSSVCSRHSTCELAREMRTFSRLSGHETRDRDGDAALQCSESLSCTRVVEVPRGSSRASSVCTTLSSREQNGDVEIVRSDVSVNRTCVVDIERQRSKGRRHAPPDAIFADHDGSNNKNIGNVEFLKDATRPRVGDDRRAPPHVSDCSISIPFSALIDLEPSRVCVMHSHCGNVDKTGSNTQDDGHITDTPVRRTSSISTDSTSRSGVSTTLLHHCGACDEPYVCCTSLPTEHARETISARLRTTLRLSSNASNARSSTELTDGHHATHTGNSQGRPRISLSPASHCSRLITNDPANAPAVPESHRASLSEPLLSSVHRAHERTPSATATFCSTDHVAPHASLNVRPIAEAAHCTHRRTATCDGASRGPLPAKHTQSSLLAPPIQQSSASQDGTASPTAANDVVWKMNSARPASQTASQPERHSIKIASSVSPP